MTVYELIQQLACSAWADAEVRIELADHSSVVLKKIVQEIDEDGTPQVRILI